MKKLNYSSPYAALVELTAADVITASNTAIGEDGVIELRSYGFGMGDGSGFEG